MAFYLLHISAAVHSHAAMHAFPGPATAVFLATVGIVSAALLFAVWYAVRREPAGWRIALAAGVVLLAWIGATGLFASIGVLRAQEWPPPMPGFLVVSAGLTLLLGLSPLGLRLATQVPLAWLVGFHAFRVPVEWVLHSLYEAGVAPVQMTYAGLNWDVLSGISALAVAVLVWRNYGGARLVLAWNIAALALLATIATIALLSAPTPLRVFTEEPSSEFVTYVPYVWLPTVLVQAALLGHVLVFRALAARGALGRFGAQPASA